MSDYRKIIYGKYGSNWQDAKKSFDINDAERWGKAYEYYLRGWLPGNTDAEIIDLACGGGRLLYFLKNHGYNSLNGVDIDPKMVKLAKQVINNVGECNVLDFLERHANNYDLIIGLDIIEHFNKDEVLLFLKGCFKRLKRNGRIILQTVNADSPWGLAHRYGDFTHEICFSPDALKRLLIMCGFKLIETRELGPIPLHYSFLSSNRYLLWQIFRMGIKIRNLIETGNIGSGIFTKVFLITGCIK